MRVMNMQSAPYPGAGTMKAIATFDLELSEEVRMYGMRLVEAPDGKRMTYAACANGGRRTATFGPTLAAAITAAANVAFEEHDTAHGKTRRYA